MTIAAGYVCNEGVILCADTQETIPGYTKTDANKLIAFPGDPFTVLFAGAGNNAVQIDETVHEIALKIKSSCPASLSEFRIALRECLSEQFPRSYYPRPSGSEVSLLMAVHSQFGAELFNIADCNVSPVRKTACIGTGVILGNQLLQRHYDGNVQLTEAALICIYVIFHVKKWVDGCGGNTDIALIPAKSGSNAIFMPSDEVDKIEKYCKAYDDAVKGLLLAAPRTPKNLPLFKRYIQSTENQLLVARTSFQELEDSLREMSEQLGLNYEEMMKKGEDSANAFLRESGLEPKPSTSHNSEGLP